MAESTDNLIWLDMEMTGLDPELCVPLQVAVVITTPDLGELAAEEITIHQDEAALATMDDFVTRMHTQNGLLDAVRASTVSLTDADHAVADLLAVWTEKGRGLLSGNSIHQDRRFVNRYFPQSAEFLHYRMADVSTVKELVRRWYGSSAVYGKTESAHTALADTRASIAELRLYRERYFSAVRS